SIYTLLLKMSSSGSSEEDSTTISSQEYSTELRSESSLREAETFHSQYVVSKTIGHGAYGKVKLAQHHLTGTPMAVNVLQKKKLWDHPVSSEVDIMMMINHSNIILLVQVIESEKSTYLIMVLAKGHELYDYVQEAGHLEDLQANPKCHFLDSETCLLLAAPIYLKEKMGVEDIPPRGVYLLLGKNRHLGKKLFLPGLLDDMLYKLDMLDP
ncbi:hypothetical protein STEG23_028174, partial [Scotinomys teguina]